MIIGGGVGWGGFVVVVIVVVAVGIVVVATMVTVVLCLRGRRCLSLSTSSLLMMLASKYGQPGLPQMRTDEMVRHALVQDLSIADKRVCVVYDGYCYQSNSL